MVHLSGITPDGVKSYLLTNPEILEECILETMTSSHVDDLMRRKLKLGNKQAPFNEYSLRGTPVIQDRFLSIDIEALESKLLEELSNRPDYLPLLYEFINVIGLALKVDGYALYVVKPGSKEIKLYIPNEGEKYSLKPADVAAEKPQWLPVWLWKISLF